MQKFPDEGTSKTYLPPTTSHKCALAEVVKIVFSTLYWHGIDPTASYTGGIRKIVISVWPSPDDSALACFYMEGEASFEDMVWRHQ
jgi:hypothetical protein